MSCSVHDVTDLERRGVTAMFVASSEFVDAADRQMEALGVEVCRVFVPHPIQDRTDDEVRQLADDAVDAIIARSRPSPRPALLLDQPYS